MLLKCFPVQALLNASGYNRVNKQALISQDKTINDYNTENTGAFPEEEIKSGSNSSRNERNSHNYSSPISAIRMSLSINEIKSCIQAS